MIIVSIDHYLILSCILMILGRSGDSQDQPSLQYYAQLFYSPTARNYWQVKFAVTKNTKVDIKVCMCMFF